MTVAGSLQKLVQMQGGKLHAFCNAGAQGSLAAVVEMLGCIKAGRSLNVQGAKSSTFLNQVLAKLAHFLTVEGADSKKVAGAEAMKALLTQERAHIAKAGSSDLSRLEKFISFSWLLSPEEDKEVDGWKEGALKALGVALKRPTETPSSSKDADKALQAKTKKAKNVKAAVDALFE
eukprot:15442866-Alexandrium_andersonii.AAC.1